MELFNSLIYNLLRKKSLPGPIIREKFVAFLVKTCGEAINDRKEVKQH